MHLCRALQGATRLSQTRKFLSSLCFYHRLVCDLVLLSFHPHHLAKRGLVPEIDEQNILASEGHRTDINN